MSTIKVGSNGHVHLNYMVDNPFGHGPVPTSFDLTAHIKSVIGKAVAEALAARDDLSLGSNTHDNPDMSLRDYFAAHFAAALMTATSADSDLPNLDYQREAGGPTLAERVAATAYRLADAMLAAREKESRS